MTGLIYKLWRRKTFYSDIEAIEWEALRILSLLLYLFLCVILLSCALFNRASSFLDACAEDLFLVLCYIVIIIIISYLFSCFSVFMLLPLSLSSSSF